MTKTLVSYCTNRIAPAAAAVALALTGGSAMASTVGQQKVTDKLSPTFIPTAKAGTTIVTAKTADVLLALSLALQDPLNAAVPTAEIAEAVLEVVGTKVRADKDKIAGQVIATAVAARGLTNEADIAALTKAVFNVNGTNPNAKLKLTAVGQAAALAGAIKASPASANGALIGSELYSQAQTSTTISTLLANTATALGVTNPTAAATLKEVVKGLLTDVSNDAAGTVRVAAEKAAAKNIVAAGAFYGGLVDGNTSFDESLEQEGLAATVIGNTKLAKAYGEILANVTGAVSDRGALATSLSTSKPAAQALIAQGLLRTGNATTDVTNIIGGVGVIKDKAKFAAVALLGQGDSLAGDAAARPKVGKIVETLVPGLTSVQKSALGVAAIGAVASTDPAAAQDVTRAILASLAPNEKQGFAINNVAKLKNYVAAGYMAKEVASGVAADSTSQAAFAAAVMKKGVKAAPDVARQIASLPANSQPVTFVLALTNDATNGKFIVQSAAVGVSMHDYTQAGAVTAAAVTHNPTLDKASLGKAATIAGAVAKAVDEEASADIAAQLALKMSNLGTGLNRPIKTSLAAALATALAKEIQTKPGVRLANRMDELGEIAAALTAGVLGQTSGKTQATLIAGIGSALLKSLSKTATLSANPNSSTNAALVAQVSTGKADLWEARDIAGSIAQVIKNTQNPTVVAELLGTDNTNKANYGPLLTAFLKLSGKAGSPTYNAVLEAFDQVRNGTSGTKFEIGTEDDKETDTRNG